MTLQVDTTKVGLGAVLIQKDTKGVDKPVAITFKNLTPAETRYANIEYKMLTVVFGCLKFHIYLYGRTSRNQHNDEPQIAKDSYTKTDKKR